MVNFMWQLDWATWCLDTHEMLFLDMSVMEEIGIWIAGLSKADGLPKVDGHHTMC